LTRVRSQLVSRQHLAEVAAVIGLGSHLRLSRRRQGRSQAQEHRALQHHGGCFGALFLDGGLEPVTAFVRRWVMGEAASN